METRRKDEMTEQLEIFALGGLAIQRGKTPITGLASRKAEALLVYLACTGRPHAREVLADLLWDDRPQAQALGNLRVLLTSLRQELAPYLTITRQEVTFNEASPHRLDVADLERELAIALKPAASLADSDLDRLASALALYRGDFLRGFYIRDSRGFEDWLGAERERIRLAVIEVQQRLVAAYLDRGQYPAGIEWARRLLQLEPLEEAAHRQLMRLLALSGQRPAALAQYETCRRLLADELGVDPAAETTALYERIRTGELAGLPAARKAGPEITPILARPARSGFPIPPTPCLGREEELAQISERLANPACRLLTLAGPGGIGKTRLAIEMVTRLLAGSLAPVFADGVYFVSLDPVSSAEFLVPTIADALNFSFYAGVDPAAQLFTYLSEKQMLLVLDNFEHLMGGVELLARLLQHAPQVKFMVASRERLNLREEWVLPIQGLKAPEVTDNPAGLALESYSAAQLFLQRAAATSPGFAPTEADKVCVAWICRLVEGAPLALELAAAWVRLLSCREIAAEIASSLDFLATSLRNIPERHRSLRAVFDHSWELLSDEERRVFRQLAVFRGGFRREAAARVVGASPALLLALMDKSLLHQNQAGRYLRHALLWQYAAEKLDELPQEKERVQACYGDYYAAFLAEREARLIGAEQQAALADLSGEIENIRTAWQWAVARRQLSFIARALSCLFHFYDMHSWFQEGAEIFGQAVTALAGTTSPILVAKLLARQGWFTFQLGRHEQARGLLRESLELLTRVEPTPETRQEMIFPLNYLGAVHYHLGEYPSARQYLTQSLALCAELNDRFGLTVALNNLSQVAYRQGDYSQARRLGQESLAVKREIGDRRGMAFSLTNLGQVAQALAEYTEARRLFRESQAIYQEVGDRRGTALTLVHLGDVAQALTEYAEARELYRHSLAIFREIGNQWGIIVSRNKLGQVASQLGDDTAAREELTEALKLAMEVEAVPAALDVVVGLAALLAHGTPAEQTSAIRMVAVVLSHPATTVETGDRAVRLLAELKAALPGDVVTRATGQGRTGGLEAVVNDFLNGR